MKITHSGVVVSMSDDSVQTADGLLSTNGVVKLPVPLTAADLDHIDAITGITRHSAVTSEPLEEGSLLHRLGFTHYADIEWFRSRRPYERSRWIRHTTGRLSPVLYVLATYIYGELTTSQQPWWKDKDYLNNDLSNIVLTESRLVPTQLRNKYGVRSNTAEYRKAYFADPANKERIKASVRRSSQNQRDELKRAKTAIASDKLATDKLDELASRLGLKK